MYTYLGPLELKSGGMCFCIHWHKSLSLRAGGSGAKPWPLWLLLEIWQLWNVLVAVLYLLLPLQPRKNLCLLKILCPSLCLHRFEFSAISTLQAVLSIQQRHSWKEEKVSTQEIEIWEFSLSLGRTTVLLSQVHTNRGFPGVPGKQLYWRPLQKTFDMTHVLKAFGVRASWRMGGGKCIPLL